MSNTAPSKRRPTRVQLLRRFCYSVLLVSGASSLFATGCLGDLMCSTDCEGSQPSCGSHSPDNCPTEDGCAVRTECICTTPGSCTAEEDLACSGASTAEACNAVGHCAWIPSCSGVIRPCTDFSHDEDACHAHSSCYWERNCC
jgi:hypothetical protein